ncbi:MAG: FHA domain-containing protein [Planctomycetota bacterium]|nr:MAG: FHA domain-containing protein [Planctomycetota bacterium]
MAHFRVKITKNIEKIYPIEDGMTIGREAKNQIQLLNTSVSRVHCKLLKKNNSFKIQDLGSSNGIRVNNIHVQEQLLAPGDVVQVGTMVLVFENDIFQEKLEFLDISQNPLTEEDLERLCRQERIAIQFNTSHKYVEEAVEIGERFLQSTTFDEMGQMALVMAFREAIGNAERHGHKYEYDKIIKVVYENKPNYFSLCVEDEGDGFDFHETLRKSREGDAVTAARERYQAGGMGGLGIRVMLKCVDKVIYYNKGSRLILVKYKPKEDKNEE